MEEGFSNHRWYALWVRANYESMVSASLRRKGFEEFLPLYRARRRWSDRIKELAVPLFPGYVFCRIDLNRRLPILTTPGVHSIVGNGKAPVPVEEQEIENLRLIVESRVDAEPCPYLSIGQRVRIEQGSLAGLQGIVVGALKQTRVVVSVNLLQRSVAVEIDEAWASPVDSFGTSVTRGRRGLEPVSPQIPPSRTCL